MLVLDVYSSRSILAVRHLFFAASGSDAGSEEEEEEEQVEEGELREAWRRALGEEDPLLSVSAWWAGWQLLFFTVLVVRPCLT